MRGSPQAQHIQWITWKEAKEEVCKINPGLAAEIDQLAPGKEYPLIKVRYPWGQHVLLEGDLYVPNVEGKYVPLKDSSIDAELQKQLSYTGSMPMGMVLNHSLELYINIKSKIIPFVFMSPGRIFALWAALQERDTSNHSGSVSNITAGARSLLMLPKISDIASFKKLKKEFNLRSDIPKLFSDQWKLFNELAESAKFPEQWYVEVIFFTAKWYEKIEDRKDTKWRLLRECLLNYGWEDTNYLRNQVVSDVAFSCALAAKNRKPNPYLSDTVKHLYAIGQGNYPGFKVAINDMAGPISSFQKIFNEVYGLRYAPTMLHPAYITDNPMEPIYYSLEIPTLMAFSPKSRKAHNKLDDLREVKHVMDVILNYIGEDKLRLRHTPLYFMAQLVNFNYFHSDNDGYGEILKSNKLVKLDSALIEEEKRFKGRPFCESSPFVRGCVRVAKKSC